MKRQPKDVVVAMEGDSWFTLPRLGFMKPTVGGSNSDVGRELEALGYVIRNMSASGDTIENIKNKRSYMAALDPTPDADVLLLSGGGNDFLSDGQLRNYVRQRPGGPHDWTAADHIDFAAYDAALKKIMDCYKAIFEDLRGQQRFRTLPIIVHGYDYVRPWGLVWIAEQFHFRGTELKFQAEICKILIDRYNESLLKTVRGRANIRYLRLLGTVKNEWHDELHPTQRGYAAVAAKFDKKIRSLVK